MKVLIVLIFLIGYAVSNPQKQYDIVKSETSNCTYTVLQQGECSASQLNTFQTVAVQACQLYSDDVIDFSSQLQSSLDRKGFSALAAYNISSIGFVICLGNPCYVSFSVGNYQLAAIWQGNPGPCDSEDIRRLDDV